MADFRVISSLLIKHGGAFKTTKFRKGFYLGDPINIARVWSDLGCQEICILNAVNSTQDIIQILPVIVKYSNIPITVIGGVDLINYNSLISNGADRVGFGRSVKHETLVAIADNLGKQSVSVCIDFCRLSSNLFYVRSNKVYPKILSTQEFIKLVDRYVKSGAGEVIFQNIAYDGTMNGLWDYSFIEKMEKREANFIYAGGLRKPPELVRLEKSSPFDGAIIGAAHCLNTNGTGVVLSVLRGYNE